MKVCRMNLIVVSTLSFILKIYKCSSQINHRDTISYCESFNTKDNVLIHFTDNTHSVVDIGKIEGFFIYPTQFYQLRTFHEEKSLPLFLINGKKRDLCLLLTICFHFNQREEFSKDKLKISTVVENEIFRIQSEFSKSFSSSHELTEFINRIYPDFNIAESPRFISFESSFRRIRSLVPLLFFQNLNFVSVTRNETLNEFVQEGLKKYERYYRSDLNHDKSLVKVGFGTNAVCYRIKIYFENTEEFHRKLLFKSLESIFSPQQTVWDLDEFTIFQQAHIQDKSQFSTMSCLVIERNSGSGVGYLTTLAKYGDLRWFITNYIEEFDAYFYCQLLELAKSIEFLHSKEICHSDIHLGNVFVDEREPLSLHKNVESKLSSINYRLLLGDFGTVTALHSASFHGHYSQKQQSLTTYNQVCCERCSKIIESDWRFFHSLLENAFQLLAMKQAEEISKRKYFMLLIETSEQITDLYHVERYLNELISNEFDKRDSRLVRAKYEFTADAGFLISSHHGKSRFYKKGEIIEYKDRNKYSLYRSIYGNLQLVWTANFEDIVKEINQFAKMYYNIESLLEKRSND